MWSSKMCVMVVILAKCFLLSNYNRVFQSSIKTLCLYYV